MSIATDLKQRIFDLPESDRAELALELISSLEPAESDSGVEKAWEVEVLNRLDAIDRGEVAPTDWRDAVARVQKNLRKGSPERGCAFTPTLKPNSNPPPNGTKTAW